MQLISAFQGAGIFAQAAELVHGLLVECRRLGARIGRRLDAFAEQQRSIDAQLMPLRALKALNDALGRVLDRALDTTNAAPARRREPLPERMTKDLEWALATQEFYTSRPGAAERAVALQETAALQIDAAAYALDGMIDDLRGIMSVRDRGNVFAHQINYTEEHAGSLYAAAVRVAVSEISAPRALPSRRRAA